MKRNDIKALHGMSAADLQKKLVELTKQIAEARLKKPVGRLEDVKQVSRLADDIARIKTVLTQKEMAG